MVFSIAGMIWFTIMNKMREKKTIPSLVKLFAAKCLSFIFCLPKTRKIIFESFRRNKVEDSSDAKVADILNYDQLVTLLMTILNRFIFTVFFIIISIMNLLMFIIFPLIKFSYSIIIIILKSFITNLVFFFYFFLFKIDLLLFNCFDFLLSNSKWSTQSRIL